MTDYSAKIVALEDALASGELTVESDGERVTYRSVDQLKSSLAYFRDRQQAESPSSSQSGFGFSAVAFSRE